MAVPVRIQRKRTKGWKMPENTVYVGRKTKWGNPFRVGTSTPLHCNSADEAVTEYRVWITESPNGKRLRRDINELRGKNLACWCPLDQPCHADVLLEIANSPTPQDRP